MQRLFLPILRKAEFSQLQIMPWRRQVLGADGDACLHISGALGEEIEDTFQPETVIGELRCRAVFARTRRQLFPGFGGQPAVFCESSLAQHVGVKCGSHVKRIVVFPHFASEQIVRELYRIGPRCAACVKMNIARLMKQRTAITVGIVDVLQGPLDPGNGVFSQPERQLRAAGGCEIGNTFERLLHVTRPLRCSAVIDKASRARDFVDRVAVTGLQDSLILGHCSGGHIELAQQSRIPLGQFHDHLDQGVNTPGLEIIPDARERARTVRCAVFASRVGCKRRGDHMLAKSPILEGRAGAFAFNLRAATLQHSAVILRARHLRQYALRLMGKNIYLSGLMIGLAARKHFVAGQVAQRANIEAGLVLCFHEIG